MRSSTLAFVQAGGALYGGVMPNSSRRMVLRTATREAHERLDLAVGELHSMEDYKRFLHGSYLFRTQMEHKFIECDWPGVIDPWRPTMLSHAILADLADLEVQAPAPTIQHQLFSDEQLYGVAYVLLGSALGARVLVKRAESLGFTAEHGSRFLHAQINTSADWNSFLNLLERHPELEMAQVVEASVSTFDIAKSAFIGVSYVLNSHGA